MDAHHLLIGDRARLRKQSRSYGENQQWSHGTTLASGSPRRTLAFFINARFESELSTDRIWNRQR
jgi:hypothetical protein